MRKLFPRMLLGLVGVILAAGGLMHARAYGRTVAALAGSNLAAFYAASFKALWLIDSATLITLAVLCGVLVLRPAWAAGPVIVVLAAIPAGTAFFLYRFIGTFLPAHLLTAAAVGLVVAGAAWRRAGAAQR